MHYSTWQWVSSSNIFGVMSSRDDSSALASSSLIVPLITSKRGWKPAERRVEDVPAAVLWREREADGSSSSSAPSPQMTTPRSDDSSGVTRSEEACSVCREHQSRYTCPRCQAPYCSVECYRNHTATKSKGGSDGSSSSSSAEASSSACTEAFYKSRVSSILDLEAREQKGSTQRMLNQLHQHNVSQQQNEDDETDLSDQLYELLQLLEEKQDDNLSHEALMAMLPPELRTCFQRDIQEGKIQDMVLQRWHPWWRRQLVSSGEDATSTSTPSSSSRPLDEQLLQVPKFSSICRKQQSSEMLLFNLIDILYSFCWTLRLYHGLQNVIVTKQTTTSTSSDHNESLAVDAATMFIQHSSVLNMDTRFTSLEQVLSASTADSTKFFPGGSCNAEWSILVEDCALILVSHRLVGRALLEANDLLKASIQCLKREDLSRSGGNQRDSSIGRLRQLRKKLEFFLSWSQHAKSAFGESIKDDMMEWVRRWKSDEFAADNHGSRNSDSGLVDLEIPDSRGSKAKPIGETTTMREDTAPLLIEVATMRRSPATK